MQSQLRFPRLPNKCPASNLHRTLCIFPFPIFPPSMQRLVVLLLPHLASHPMLCPGWKLSTRPGKGRVVFDSGGACGAPPQPSGFTCGGLPPPTPKREAEGQLKIWRSVGGGVAGALPRKFGRCFQGDYFTDRPCCSESVNVPQARKDN